MAQDDLLPETLPVKVEITDPAHLLMMGEVHGLMRADDLLEKHDHRALPGFQLAAALIRAEMAEARAAMITRNLYTIAKAGHDVTMFASVGARGHTLECTPFPPGEGF